MGFSLVEVQVVLVLFAIVIGGILTAYLFGLKLFEHIRPKLDVTAHAREIVGRFADEVRSATQIKVGSGNHVTFTEAPLNKPQQGSAIEIYPGASTNTFIRYFKDESENAVKRWESSSASLTVLARGVTNTFVFAAQDFAGKVMTNNVNNRVIQMELQFNRQHGVAGTERRGDYQIRTRVTRRALL